jgi:hypothetical protein
MLLINVRISVTSYTHCRIREELAKKGKRTGCMPDAPSDLPETSKAETAENDRRKEALIASHTRIKRELRLVYCAARG